MCRRSIDLGSIQIKSVAISCHYLLYTIRQAYKINILLFNFVALSFFCLYASSLRALSPFFFLPYFNQCLALMADDSFFVARIIFVIVVWSVLCLLGLGYTCFYVKLKKLSYVPPEWNWWLQQLNCLSVSILITSLTPKDHATFLGFFFYKSQIFTYVYAFSILLSYS